MQPLRAADICSAKRQYRRPVGRTRMHAHVRTAQSPKRQIDVVSHDIREHQDRSLLLHSCAEKAGEAMLPEQSQHAGQASGDAMRLDSIKSAKSWLNPPSNSLVQCRQPFGTTPNSPRQQYWEQTDAGPAPSCSPSAGFTPARRWRSAPGQSRSLVRAMWTSALPSARDVLRRRTKRRSGPVPDIAFRI
jgi:hypothetical protein